MGTFSTDANAAYFVEMADPNNPGQTKRPPTGVTIKVRSYPSLTDLPDTKTLEFGYVKFTTDASVDSVVVSLDGWASQVGPWYSAEYLGKIDQRSQVASLSSDVATADTTVSGHDASIVTLQQQVVNLQATDDGQDSQIADLYARVASGGSGTGGGAGLMIWNAVSAAYEPAATSAKIYIGPSSPTPVPLDNQGLWVKTSA